MRGIGLFIVLGAGLAALAAAGAAKATEKKPEGIKPEVEPPDQWGPPVPGPVGKAPTAFELCVDPNMPSALRLEAEKAFAAENLMPADYEKMAAIYAEAGYPVMAKCLTDLGAEKLAAKKAEVARRGGLPHVIRMGDIPSLMATWYTGVGTRFKELGPLNPQIGALKTKNGVTNYEKWIPGTEILIPAAWNPLDKPIPPPATNTKAPSDAALEKQRQEAEALVAAIQQAASATASSIAETSERAVDVALGPEINPATGQPYFAS